MKGGRWNDVQAIANLSSRIVKVMSFYNELEKVPDGFVVTSSSWHALFMSFRIFLISSLLRKFDTS